MKKLNTLLLTAALGTTMLVGCDRTKEIVAPENAQKGASASQTAQSIMIWLNIDNLRIEGEEVWEFNEIAAAKADFGYDACVTNLCSNNARQAAHAARCTYWDAAGHPFWTLKSSTVSGEAGLDIDVTVAGQSVVMNKQHPNGKASFTIEDADGSRITSLSYSIDGGAPVAMTHTLIPGWANFEYTGNAGTNGVTSLLKPDGTMASILAPSPVPASNAIGKSNISLSLPSGNHLITVFGTVKGNTGSVGESFTYTSSFRIDAMNCE